MTAADVARFQKLHKGPDGRPLRESGVIDAATQWAMDLVTLPAWRQQIVLAALEHVGLEEQGTNRGPLIDGWLLDCSCPIGNPWCAAFASMALRAGGIDARQASVLRLAALFTVTQCPLPGDIICLHRPDGTGHVDVITGAGIGVASVVGGNVGNGVRAGLRNFAGRRCYRVGSSGIPDALASLPMLGIQDR